MRERSLTGRRREQPVAAAAPTTREMGGRELCAPSGDEDRLCVAADGDLVQAAFVWSCCNVPDPDGLVLPGCVDALADAFGVACYRSDRLRTKSQGCRFDHELHFGLKCQNTCSHDARSLSSVRGDATNLQVTSESFHRSGEA